MERERAHPARSSRRCNPSCSVTVQPMRKSVERTCRALAAPQRDLPSGCSRHELNEHQRLGFPAALLHVCREDSEGDGLRPAARVLPRASVRHDARQVADLRDPATIHLAIELYRELHMPSLARSGLDPLSQTPRERRIRWVGWQMGRRSGGRGVATPRPWSPPHDCGRRREARVSDQDEA